MNHISYYSLLKLNEYVDRNFNFLAVQSPCTPPTEYVSRNGLYYSQYTEKAPLREAEKTCHDDGARLAVFDTETKTQDVRHFVSKYGILLYVNLG